MRVELDIEILARTATGRSESFFAQDIAQLRPRMLDIVSEKRVLVIGGAGTIGFAATEFIADLSPAALHVVDQNENGLAEVTRHLRSRENGLNVADFRAFPVDYGSPIMAAVLHTAGPYDIVLNFAALKHVRSEKDVPSLLQMLDTNLLKNRILMDALSAGGFSGRYFCVSTDKAANPVSLMGASKRAMEHLIFSRVCTPTFGGVVTSARFANVAFSDGSLLQSFINRLTKNQPLVAPRDTKRYFVSPRESAEICAVAALIADPDTIVVPNLNPEEHLTKIEHVAEQFLRANGYHPARMADEEEARKAARSAGAEYPLFLSALDTDGEKPYEEFVGAGETRIDLGLRSFSAVSYVAAPSGSLERLIELVENSIAGAAPISKDMLICAIGEVVPEFKHRETGLSLDGRM